MSTIANLKINIVATTTGLETGLGKTRRAIRKFRRSLNQTFGQGVRIAMVAAAAAIGAVILATKKMIAIFSEFEFKMQEVRSILLDVSDRTFARLEAQARKLGATTVFTASEAAQAMAFLARAGFNVNEVMAATPALLDLAAAATMDLAEAADITAQVVRGMGLEASEAARVADVLAYTSARTNTTVQQLGHAFGYVAPVAAALNISLEETAAMLGVLSNAGMQADRAGTGLKNVLAELAGEIERHGISALKKFTEGGIGVERAFEIFQKRGGPAIINLFKMHHITNQLVKEMEDVEGVARQMADIRMDSVHGAFKLLSSVVQELNIMIGEEMRGSIRSIQEALRRWVVGFTGALKALIEKLDLANLTVEDMVVWLGKVMKWAENAYDKVSRIGSAIMVAIHTVVGIALTGLQAINVVVGLIVTNITGFLQLIGVLSKGSYSEMVTFFLDVNKEITRQLDQHTDGVIDNFKKTFEAESDLVDNFIKDVEKKIREVGQTPIIMTIEGNVKMVLDPADVPDVEAQLAAQLKALQLLEKGLGRGDDRDAYRAALQERLEGLKEFVGDHDAAVRELESQTSRLIKMRQEEERLKGEAFWEIRAGQELFAAQHGKDLRGPKGAPKEIILQVPFLITPSALKVSAGMGAMKLEGRSKWVLNQAGQSLAKKIAPAIEEGVSATGAIGFKSIIEKERAAFAKEMPAFSTTATSELLNFSVDIQNQVARLGEAGERLRVFDPDQVEDARELIEQLTAPVDLLNLTDIIGGMSVAGPMDKNKSDLEEALLDYEKLEKQLERMTGFALLDTDTDWTAVSLEMGDVIQKMDELEIKIKTKRAALSIRPDKDPLEKMSEESQFLEDAIMGVVPMGLFAMSWPSPVPAEEMENELDYLNSRIAEYIVMLGDVKNEHDRIIDVRDKFRDVLKVDKAASDLGDSLEDWEMMVQTIDMGGREAEIFAASMAGVAQETLDAATFANFLLTSLEKSREESERLEKFGDEVRKSLEGPQVQLRDVFDKYIKDLDAAWRAGEISQREHLRAKVKAEQDLAEDLGKSAQVSVVGIQTALGTVKVGGVSIAQQQWTTAKSSLAEQKSTNTKFTELISLVRLSAGALTP